MNHVALFQFLWAAAVSGNVVSHTQQKDIRGHAQEVQVQANTAGLDKLQAEQTSSDEHAADTIPIHPPSAKGFGSPSLAGLVRRESPPLSGLASSQLGWPSYSQYRQDQKLLPILGQIEKGFYVESGAFDGETDSNTLLYELRGWDGLLVEPSPDTFKTLLSRNRKAYSFNGALSSTNKRETIDFHNVAGDRSNYGSLLEVPPITVPAVPLADLLRQMNRRTVDFWSLDIEGAEGRVLDNTDFKKIEVGVIMIEMNKNDENNKLIRTVLDREGFRENGVMNSGSTGRALDRVFVNPQYFLKRGLKVPTHIGD